MKKLMFLSAIAGAILITTATTSCKKGDKGDPGAGANGKDGGAITLPMAQSVLRIASKSYNDDKVAGVTSKSIDNADKLMTVADRKKLVEDAGNLKTAEEKKDAQALANKRLSALDVIVKYRKSHPAIVSPAGAISANVTALKGALTVSEGAGTNKILPFGTRKSPADAHLELDEIDKLNGLLDAVSTITASDIDVARKTLNEELEVANKLEVVTTVGDRTKRVEAAKKTQLTDVEGNPLTLAYDPNHADAFEGDDAGGTKKASVSIPQKKAAKKLVSSRKALISAINDLDKLSPSDALFTDLEITADLRKELGLTPATTTPATKR